VIKIYDTIIIGTGVAGYSAAVYNARFKLNTLVLGKRIGGLLQDTHVIENWPGIISIPGADLMKNLKAHVESYKVPIKEEEVIDVSKVNGTFKVRTSKQTYESKTIIFATGSERRKLDVPGVKEFENKGVSYCAICDAPLFKDKVVGVVGGSDSAAKEALLLSEYAKKVYIIYRKESIRAEPINLQRVKENKKIEIINNTNVMQVKGDKFITQVIFDKPYKDNEKFKLDGLFIEIGQIPGSALAKKLGVKVNAKSEILIDCDSKTSVKGVFAAGDVVDTIFKQAITGAGEAVKASFSAFNYVKSKK
tara:strand:+ start:3304 stop:4221 length:918 start_codon:yes stop_codon:yes gene_type:complete